MAIKAKRQVMLETAYDLFRRHGFHATGIDRIVADADVAKMTMYRHFPTKDDLIVEVLNWRAQRFERQLDQLTAKVDTVSGKIAAIFDWYGRWFESPEFNGCLFAHAIAEFGDASHPVFKAASSQKAYLRDYMSGLMQQALPKDQADDIATAFLMLIEGATLLAQLGKGREAIRNARKAALSLLEQAAGIS